MKTSFVSYSLVEHLSALQTEALVQTVIPDALKSYQYKVHHGAISGPKSGLTSSSYHQMFFDMYFCGQNVSRYA